MRAEPLRVLCVDDHEFIADGMQARLSIEVDMEVVGWLDSADQMVDEIRRTRADIVLFDIEMPGPEPFAALADLTKREPGVRAIMLSAFVREQYIEAAVAAGAWGYLAKSDAPDSVVDAIRQVSRDEFAFGPMVLERCAQRRNVPSDGARSIATLDLDQRRMLAMIAQGMTCSDIAAAVHSPAEVVDSDRAAIMRKLGVSTPAELARCALREGLVEST